MAGANVCCGVWLHVFVFGLLCLFGASAAPGQWTYWGTGTTRTRFNGLYWQDTTNGFVYIYGGPSNLGFFASFPHPLILAFYLLL